VAPIRHYQFAQTAPDRLELRLVTTRPLAEVEIAHVLDWARRKFGDGFHFNLAFPAELGRSQAGKFEDFVSLL
jgi:phenylacetate-CoA ligase